MGEQEGNPEKEVANSQIAASSSIPEKKTHRKYDLLTKPKVDLVLDDITTISFLEQQVPFSIKECIVRGYVKIKTLSFGAAVTWQTRYLLLSRNRLSVFVIDKVTTIMFSQPF